MSTPHETSTLTVKPSVLKARESHFSWLRTRLSIERTMMSWLRTGTALIGFGFTIFQFFDRLNQMPSVGPPRHPKTPQLLSLALIGVGTLVVIVALMEYRKEIRYLWLDEFKDIAGIGDRPGWTPAFSAGVLLSLIGVVTLFTLLVRAVF